MSAVPAWTWGLLIGLLLASGFLSGSETALFSLSREQRGRAGRAARHLLERPRALLVTVLLGNLIVNVLFFAFADRLDDGSGGRWGELLIALGVLVALLVFGEILPKTLALRGRLAMARFSSPALVLLVGVLGRLASPAVRLLERVHVLADRLLPVDRAVTPATLAQVLARGAEEGLLVGEEADILSEVVELGEVRVREIMTPRVDALFLDVEGRERERVVRAAVEVRQSWLPVVEGTPDSVVGRVRVRELLREPERSPRELVMPVKFVPEVATALDLLRILREDRTAEAVVVDEWGGTAGYVTAEQVFEEIVGDLRAEGEVRVPAVVPLGENRFRVAGGLSIRDWNDAFGQRVVPVEYETVGGFVTALLGRIPRAGDEVRAENLVLAVHEVRGRRVQTVDIGVETVPEADPGAGGNGRRGEGNRP